MTVAKGEPLTFRSFGPLRGGSPLQTVEAWGRSVRVSFWYALVQRSGGSTPLV